MAMNSMKGWDPTGNLGPKKPLPDTVTIQEPPVDKVVAEPTEDSWRDAIAWARSHDFSHFLAYVNRST